MNLQHMIVTVGGSTTGKTAFSYELAGRIPDSLVANGDMYELYSDFPLASGAADALRHDHRKTLYEIISPAEPHTTASEYTALLQQQSEQWPGTVIVDGLSMEYLPALAAIQDRKIIIIGLLSSPRLEADMYRRLDEAIDAGLIEEVRAGIKKFGRQIWLADNSLVISTTLQYLDEGWTREEFRRRLVADGMELGTRRKENALREINGITWTRNIADVLAML